MNALIEIIYRLPLPVIILGGAALLGVLVFGIVYSSGTLIEKIKGVDGYLAFHDTFIFILIIIGISSIMLVDLICIIPVILAGALIYENMEYSYIGNLKSIGISVFVLVVISGKLVYRIVTESEMRGFSVFCLVYAVIVLGAFWIARIRKIKKINNQGA